MTDYAEPKPETQTTNVMIDIETMGTLPGSAVLSIGAVVLETGEDFYTTIDLKSCQKHGLTVCASTLKWWLQQPLDARKEIYSRTAPSLPKALQKFKTWFGEQVIPGVPPQVWGNGAAFDIPLLDMAFDACELETPWKFWNVKCYRTLKTLFPLPFEKPNDVPHHALEDARFQAEHLKIILAFIGSLTE